MSKKIVVTGGHLTPALAVIEELEKRGGWEIIFFGRKFATEADKTPSVESILIPQKGIKFITIFSGRLQRRLTWYTIPSLLKVPLGLAQSLFLLFKIRPEVILSFGGYLSVPVVFSGWILGIPILTHEQTSVKGLATRINSLFAKKIAVSWPDSLNSFPVGKTILTGNPIRKEINKEDEVWFKSLKFKKDRPLVFITGGNQGSHLINEAVRKSLPRLLKKVNVFHQCGHLEIHGDSDKLGKLEKEGYQVEKYIDGGKMGAILKKADLVVSRSGANIVTEILFFGKPCLLIPFPWLYGDEQLKNAQMIVNTGMGEILPQSMLNPATLTKKIIFMLGRIGEYQKNAAKAKKLVINNASSKIVDLLDQITL